MSASLRHVAKYATGVAKAVRLMGDPGAVAAEARERFLPIFEPSDRFAKAE
jgi:hypothetical protein